MAAARAGAGGGGNLLACGVLPSREDVVDDVRHEEQTGLHVPPHHQNAVLEEVQHLACKPSTPLSSTHPKRHLLCRSVMYHLPKNFCMRRIAWSKRLRREQTLQLGDSLTFFGQIFLGQTFFDLLWSNSL